MKSKFSTSWNKSKQPRKQRKYLANAPNHLRHKLLSAHLDKSLRDKLKRRSLEIRKNDEVKVMRGKYKKKSGKVLLVDRTKLKIQIDGINVTKKDGEKVPVWFHPSNLKIIKLDDSDKKRLKKKTIPEKPQSKSETKSKEAKKEENKEK